MVDVLLGLQWGDEGKGKIVDFLAKDYDIIARFQGGPNAGHTIYLGDKKMVLHTIPSGVFHSGIINVIGNGVVIDPVILKKELSNIESFGFNPRENLFVSERAHIILPTHRALDKARELSKGDRKIGSTLKGIGPTYMDKTGRNTIRVGDLFADNFIERYDSLKKKHLEILHTLNFTEDINEYEDGFFEAVEKLKELNVIAVEYFLNNSLAEGKRILAEGAQGTMLDIDFGTYPFVTSSNTITAGLCTGLGIPPNRINKVFGITKAYCTRVGSGPFPTELFDEMGDELRKRGHEFGATTGRPRRCGWIDLVALKYACMINGVTDLIITKTDVLDGIEELKAAVAYQIDGNETDVFPYEIPQEKFEPVYSSIKGWMSNLSECKTEMDLPETFMDYKNFLEKYLETKVSFISNGVAREALIELQA